MSDVPPVELGPARVGDIGTLIILAIQERDLNGVLIPVDLVPLTAAVITIQRPDGTVILKTASVLDPPMAGQISATTGDGDLTEAGRYPIQGQITLSGSTGGVAGTWSTSEAVLIVDRSL